MNSVERHTRTHLMALFEQHQMHPRGDLGQNFLIDLNLIDFIVRRADLTAEDVVLEVGAGTGSLTQMLAAYAGQVVTVEYDGRLIPLLQATLGKTSNVTVLHTDALRNKNQLADIVLSTVREKLAEAPNRKLKLIANLPYHVATPVMSNLVVSDLPWARMVVTIQWELGERMLAGPGTGEYSALSAWLQAQCKMELLKKLSPDVFWPRPKVHSAILQVDPDPERAATIADRQHLHQLLRDAFTQRRKRLLGTLAQMYKDQLSREQLAAIWVQLGLEPTVRAEELAPAVLVALSNAIRAIGLPATARLE